MTVLFARLAARFDYPDVLTEPTATVLAKFRAGGDDLVRTWWAFAWTAVLMVPLVVLTSAAIPDADPTVLSLATTTGVLAAAVQFLGLIRWPFLVPHLAASEASEETVDLVFQAFNRYLGAAVGEHLGYAFTGAWTTLTAVALTQTTQVPGAIGVVGLVVGPVLAACTIPRLEKLTPVAYVAWSLWLIATGVALIA